jgi:hypothetical protein
MKLALVINFIDYSRLNNCSTFTFCGNQFELIKDFNINKNIFAYLNNKLTNKLKIKGYLAHGNSTCKYLDIVLDLKTHCELSEKMTVLELGKCN